MIRKGKCRVRAFLGPWLGLAVPPLLGMVGALAAGAPDPNAPEQATSIVSASRALVTGPISLPMNAGSAAKAVTAARINCSDRRGGHSGADHRRRSRWQDA
jgi:hypothetical protein